MPNNVTNKLTIIGTEEEVNEVIKFVDGGVNEYGDRSYMDFNKIVPTPENIFQGNLGQEERAKYGKLNWYDWNRLNWGTKWNAYSSSVEGNTITFDTAWENVDELMFKLSKKFPEVKFYYKYADEDLGYNLGHLWIKNGEYKEINEFIEGSDEAIEFACQVKGINYEEYLKEIEENN